MSILPIDLIFLSVLGENHRCIGVCYSIIGYVYDRLRKFDKALDFFNQALKISQTVLGEKHPDTVIKRTDIDGAIMICNLIEAFSPILKK